MDDDELMDDVPVTFVGPCTCEHEPEQHGWGSCAVEGCSCTAGWEE